MKTNVKILKLFLIITTLLFFSVGCFGGCDESDIGGLTSVETYKVCFVDYDGSELMPEQTVVKGSSAYAPVLNPTREGYEFTGWDKDFRVITEDLTVTAQYLQNTYTVTFYDYNGEIISSVSVNHGENATLPTAPQVPGMQFVGWKGKYINVLSDADVYADYRTLRHVTFVDDKGETIKEEDVLNGEAVLPPENISFYKQNCYFSGWSGDLNVIKADTVFKPVFSTNDNIEGLKIYKKSGDDFNVMLLADIQVINTDSANGKALVATGSEKYQVYSDRKTCVYDTVDTLIKNNNPDYLVLMGDNVYSRFDTENLDAHKELMQIMDGYKIPWSIIFGNHDADVSDNPITRKQVIDVYKQSEYFMFEQEENAECGDYVVSLINEGSNTVETQFVFMFTGENSGNVKENQLKWYESKMEKLVNGNDVIPSVLFAHIPFADMYYGVVEQYDDKVVLNGNNEFDKLDISQNSNGDFGLLNSYAYSAQHGLFSYVKRYKSTQSVFFGHNHNNDFSISIDGIRMTHALKTGYYDQNIDDRGLNGGTLLRIDSNGTGYSIIHKFIDDGKQVKTEGGTYNFNRNFEGEIDNDYLFLDYTSSLGSVAGGNKITLTQGGSAYIEFDVVDGIRYNTGSDGLQAGFRVSPNPISSSWPSQAFYTHFMINDWFGDDKSTTAVVHENVVPKTYSYYDSPDYAEKGIICESVFNGGKTLRYTVYSDGTYTMQMKNTGEDVSAYEVFCEGVINFDITNGFYMGFTFNRDITVDNLVITGSDYITGYHFAGVNPVISGLGNSTKYTMSTSMGYIYGSNGFVLSSESDSVELEFTLIKPQGRIYADTPAGFCLTTDPGLDWPSDTASGLFLYSNQEYTTISAGTGVSSTMEAITNTFVDASAVHTTGNPKWSGNMLFKNYITYKFTLDGAGNFTLQMKSALNKDDVFQTVLKGKVTEGLSNSATLYIGYLFNGECEISNFTVNGQGEISLHNATVV